MTSEPTEAPPISVAQAQLRDSYSDIKSELSVLDDESRTVMSTLYDLNEKLKSANKKQSILDNKYYWIESEVKKTSGESADLEAELAAQRAALSQRLIAIYKLADESIVRSVFSSSNRNELDETMRYLKIISDYDFSKIKKYKSGLAKLNDKKKSLSVQIKRLISAKKNLKQHEAIIESQQIKKSSLLSQLNQKKEKTITSLRNIRSFAKRQELESMLDLSFYDNKGKLNWPVSGSIIKDYGVTTDPQFKFQLRNKGLRFVTPYRQKVVSIHDGRVVYNGILPGYGNTVIVDHGDAYYSVYSLLDSSNVSVNQNLKSKEMIGRSTENTYFEIRYYSESINPKLWLASNKDTP